MGTSTHTVAMVAAWALLSAAAVAQQATLPQSSSPTGVVSLVGCVERVPATEPAGRGNAPPAYKLIDVQPGPGTRMPLKPDLQYLLMPSKTLTTPIDLGKFQNQRVEVSGTISAAPAVTPVAGAKAGTRTEPLPTLIMASMKTVSTECK